MKKIPECKTPEEVLEKMCLKHTEEKKDDLGMYLCDFLNLLIKERLLLP